MSLIINIELCYCFSYNYVIYTHSHTKQGTEHEQHI